MAKKRSGTGSNLGLIITLIFFVLSTTILGVTTYLGFSNQEDHIKAKEKAEKDKSLAENDKLYHRMVNRTLRAWMGSPAKDKDVAADVAREKKQFDDGQFAPAKAQPDKEEVATLFKTLAQVMPWDASKDTAPSTTYDQRITDLGTEIAKGKASLQKAEASVKKVEEEKKDLEKMKEEATVNFNKALEEVKKSAKADLDKYVADNTTNQKRADAEGTKREGLAKEKDDASRNVVQLRTQVKQLEGKIVKSVQDMREMRDERDELKTKLSALYEKTGLDFKTVEAAQLDAQARKVLDAWKKDWRIVEMDRRGEMPFISLGSADGLTAQVTFSIHGLGPNGRLNPTPKGTIEVVRILGSHQAQGRLTSIHDAKKDPIMKGDRLFNPTWDPNRRRHVAIAGIVDLGGDGSDNSEDLRRLLARQKVILDAYIETKDDKSPKIIGKVGVNTDYLVLGEGLRAVRHAKSEDKDYTAAFDRMIKELKEKASASGVAVISLRRYLDMIGYQPPKIVSTGPAR